MLFLAVCVLLCWLGFVVLFDRFPADGMVALVFGRDVRLPWYYHMTPGCLGAFFVFTALYFGPRIGMALLYLLIMCGQLL